MDDLTLSAFPPRRQVRDTASPVTLRLAEPDAAALLEVLLSLLGHDGTERTRCAALAVACQVQGALRGRP